jgi:hypothetical protein
MSSVARAMEGCGEEIFHLGWFWIVRISPSSFLMSSSMAFDKCLSPSAMSLVDGSPALFLALSK